VGGVGAAGEPKLDGGVDSVGGMRAAGDPKKQMEWVDSAFIVGAAGETGTASVIWWVTWGPLVMAPAGGGGTVRPTIHFGEAADG
jgi:hypothetical protein